MHIANLHNLQHLNLVWCYQITDAGLMHIANLHNLQHLGFGNDSFNTKIEIANFLRRKNMRRQICTTIKKVSIISTIALVSAIAYKVFF